MHAQSPKTLVKKLAAVSADPQWARTCQKVEPEKQARRTTATDDKDDVLIQGRKGRDGTRERQTYR